MNEELPRAGSDSSLESLLRPTLQPGSLEKPLFSVRANFFVAFFGGVYGSALFTSINLKRMNRLRHGLWMPILMVLAWSVVVWLTGRAIVLEALPPWLEYFGPRPTSTIRHVGSLVALVFFGLHFLRYRPFYKSQSLAGVDPPNPWPLGLASIGVAIVVTIAVIAISMGVARG